MTPGEPRQWHGLYLATVTNNRPGDLRVRAQVPQVMGTAATDWMAPMLDPRGITPYQGTAFAASSLPPGPGPAPGTRILVMFIGGNINTGVYCLYGGS